MTAEDKKSKRADEIVKGDLIRSKNATWIRVEDIERVRSGEPTLLRLYGPMGVHIRTVKMSEMLEWAGEFDV